MKKTKRNYKKIVINSILIVIGIIGLVIGLWILSGEGRKPSKIPVFKVGEEKVYQDEVNFSILQNVLNLELNEEALNAKPYDGSTADEYYKKEILKEIMDYKVEVQVAKKKGISLTEDDEKKVKNDALEYASKIDGRILRELDIDMDCVIRIYKERYLAYLLKKDFTKDIKAEDQDFSTVYMLLFPKVVMKEDGDYETQEDGETPIMLSTKEIEENKENADKAYKEIIAGADIKEVAEKYDVSNASGEESNVPDSFGEPFSKYIKEMKEGETSKVIDTPSCFAIIQMIKKNNEKLASQITDYYEADLKKEAVNDQVAKWYKEVEISQEPEFIGNVWKEISLYDFTNYVEE